MNPVYLTVQQVVSRTPEDYIRTKLYLQGSLDSTHFDTFYRHYIQTQPFLLSIYQTYMTQQPSPSPSTSAPPLVTPKVITIEEEEKTTTTTTPVSIADITDVSGIRSLGRYRGDKEIQYDPIQHTLFIDHSPVSIVHMKYSSTCLKYPNTDLKKIPHYPFVLNEVDVEQFQQCHKLKFPTHENPWCIDVNIPKNITLHKLHDGTKANGHPDQLQPMVDFITTNNKKQHPPSFIMITTLTKSSSSSSSVSASLSYDKIK